jgi:hypothetical protein
LRRGGDTMPKTEFSLIYLALRDLMTASAKGMSVLSESPGYVQFKARWPNPLKPKQPMWFGAVRQGKAYVSYHLLPLYSHPELAKTISPALKKRMQGKACFNFSAPDPILWKELAKLTMNAAKIYAKPFEIRKAKAR